MCSLFNGGMSIQQENWLKKCIEANTFTRAAGTRAELLWKVTPVYLYKRLQKLANSNPDHCKDYTFGLESVQSFIMTC